MISFFFMENMMVSGKGRLILEQVVSMADKLDLGLLAEGVETQKTNMIERSKGTPLSVLLLFCLFFIYVLQICSSYALLKA